jgi:hypothetical protein
VLSAGYNIMKSNYNNLASRYLLEAHHLHLLVNVKASNKRGGADVAVGTKGKYSCRYMKDDCINNDHVFCPSEGPRT